MIPFVTLISPQSVASHDSDYYIGRRGQPPLNIAYLARAMKDADVDYDVIDCLASDNVFHFPKYSLRIAGLEFNDVIDRIHPQTSIVGISAMFTNEWLIVKELTERIREKCPDAMIIIGGEHATAMAELILKYEKNIDVVFLGEADESFKQFVLTVKNKEDFKKNPGIAFLDSDQKVVMTPRSPRLINIDTILPCWDKIPVRFYTKRRYSFSRIDVSSMPILSTRGCPYKCTFCSNENMWGNRYVMRSVDSVISEMKYNIENYKVENFDFLDLATSVNRKWFIDLLNALITELPGITWKMSVGTRSEILDEEILMLLKKSGTTQIAYAPETGSKRLTKIIRKQINHEKIFNSVRTALRLDIDIKVHTIIGFPQETAWDLIQTLFMALKFGWYGAKSVTVFVFTPYPGAYISDVELGFKNLTEEQYTKMLFDQAHNAAGARVFDITQVFKYPKEQFYTFVSNVVMVLSYFVGAVRHPSYWKDLYINVKSHSPKCTFEFVVYAYMAKLKVLSKKPV